MYLLRHFYSNKMSSSFFSPIIQKTTNPETRPRTIDLPRNSVVKFSNTRKVSDGFLIGRNTYIMTTLDFQSRNRKGLNNDKYNQRYEQTIKIE